MPDPRIWASGISAVANLFGGNRQARQQRQNINLTNQHNREMAEYAFTQNKEMAEYAYSKELEQWNRQNKYNSPEAQMQRYQNAGLNPHLIYGQGTPGNASSSPSYQSAQYSPPAIDNRGKQDTIASYIGAVKDTTNSLMDLKQKQTTIENTAENTAVRRLEKRITSMKIPGANLQYLKDINEASAYSHIPATERRQLYIQRLKADLNKTQLENIGIQLKNTYQRDVNRLSAKNMSLSDSLYLRMLISTMESLGIDTSTLQQLQE